jgi:hypothetical protein
MLGGFMKNDSQNQMPIVEEVNGKRVVSITEAARINNVTRQAIYVAIKQRKLKAHKERFNTMDD